MLRVVPVGLAINLALASVGLSGSASAQLPTRSSEPRLAVPRSDLPVAQTPGQPTTAPTAAQPGNQTTAATSPDTTPGPAPVTQVTGGASGVTQLGGATSAPPTSSTSYAAISRGYDASKFALTVGGLDAGWLQSVEGGGPSADVVIEKLGPDNITHKHLAGVKYDDITIRTGLDAKPIMNWIAETWDGKSSRRDGSVLAANFDGKAVAEQQFFHALITETTFPRLDASSKDAAHITVTLAPEYTRAVAGSGAPIPGSPTALLQKRWIASNFRFEMDGLDGSRVSRIDSFTVSQKVSQTAVGELRDYEKLPAQLEFPNLKVTLGAAYAQTWSNWLNDFVVQGNNGQAKERNGSIVYLSSNLQTELARINLFNCGIFGLEPDKALTGSDAIRRVTANLYCERMQLQMKN